MSDFDILRVVRVVRPDYKQGHQRTENSSPGLINYLAASVGGGDGVEGDKKFSCYYDNCLPVSQSMTHREIQKLPDTGEAVPTHYNNTFL